MRIRYVGTMLVAATMVMTAGAMLSAQQRWGDVIDPKTPKVTLAQIVDKPGTYEGKTVVLEGTHGGACADGLDFYLKDKFEIVEATPPSPQVMQLKKGTRVRIVGVVKLRRHGGAEAGEKKENAAGKPQNADVEVSIVAKGVEVVK